MKKSSGGIAAARRADLPNKVRIIGGRWRGTRVEVPALSSVRPSPDRVRETLFNWVQVSLPGAHCLDLFAGSGVLGLEALSRGAARVVFVDRDPTVVRHIRETLARLQAAESATVECMAAAAYLQRRTEIRHGDTIEATAVGPPFDMVFLDPPFSMGLLPRVCELLACRGWLAKGAQIYMESEFITLPELPAGYELIRSKKAGQVGYHLATWAAGSADAAGVVG